LSAPYLTRETGTIRKKWKGRFPVALLYPNTYPLAVSNLGFQLVYSLLNRQDRVVCERFVYPETPGPLRSLESARPLGDFPLVLGSISFEHDFFRLAGMLAAGGIEPYAAGRPQRVAPGTPLVVLGGAAVFMNPEPLAPFADLMVIGEAEPVLPDLVRELAPMVAEQAKRHHMHHALASRPGCYVPPLYRFSFSPTGVLDAIRHPATVPARVRKVVLERTGTASHSMQLSPDAELGMYMTELGRGCSRGCRFCAAGFIYRPPRLWSREAVVAALERRPQGVRRVGLLGMEMAESAVLDRIAGYLRDNNCSLSFSSLRADRISERLLCLLAASRLKSVAIAPDGCSERLRRLINKGLTERDLLQAARALVEAGIVHLKLYVMLGLPTETEEDLDEFIDLVHTLRERILPGGRKRGRVATITLSVNSFVPKPWTPFQYVSYGGLAPEAAMADRDGSRSVMALRQKIRYLRRGLKGIANLRFRADRPERVLQQAVFSRGDRRLAPVLLAMGSGGRSFRRAMREQGLDSWQYAIRPRQRDETMCWQILDHGIRAGYLWQEYQKAMQEQQTKPCDTARCRRCGVCNAFTAP